MLVSFLINIIMFNPQSTREVVHEHQLINHPKYFRWRDRHPPIITCITSTTPIKQYTFILTANNTSVTPHIQILVPPLILRNSNSKNSVIKTIQLDSRSVVDNRIINPYNRYYTILCYYFGYGQQSIRSVQIITTWLRFK